MDFIGHTTALPNLSRPTVMTTYAAAANGTATPQVCLQFALSHRILYIYRFFLRVPRLLLLFPIVLVHCLRRPRARGCHSLLLSRVPGFPSHLRFCGLSNAYMASIPVNMLMQVISTYYGIANNTVGNPKSTNCVFETIGQSYAPADLAVRMPTAATLHNTRATQARHQQQTAITANHSCRTLHILLLQCRRVIDAFVALCRVDMCANIARVIFVCLVLRVTLLHSPPLTVAPCHVLQQFDQTYGIPLEQKVEVIGPNDPSSCSSPANCEEAELDIQVITAIAQQGDTTFWSIPGEESFLQVC